MNRLSKLIALLFILVLAGCAASPEEQKRERKSLEAAEVNAELGLRYMLEGNNVVALEKLERALRFNPDSVAANHYLAELYRRLDKPEDAEKYFMIAMDNAQDKDYALINNFGVFLCDQGRVKEAAKQFKKVLDDPLYQAKDRLYENMGLCLLRLEGEEKKSTEKVEKEKAEELLRKALSINPKLPKSLLAMGQMSYEKENYLSARAYLQRYLEVARQTPESLWLGIRVEREMGDKNALASYALQLRQRFPNSEETKHYLDSLKQ